VLTQSRSGGLFLRGQSGGSVNLTTQSTSNADVNNQWSYTSSPQLSLHGTDRESCTLMKRYAKLIRMLHKNEVGMDYIV
jgi:hypothetical protein